MGHINVKVEYGSVTKIYKSSDPDLDPSKIYTDAEHWPQVIKCLFSQKWSGWTVGPNMIVNKRCFDNFILLPLFCDEILQMQI